MKNLLTKLNLKTTYTKTNFNNVYSINLTTINLPFFSNGKGFNENDSLNSAYGEMCERILTRNYFEDYYLSKIYPDSKITNNFLNKDLHKFYLIEELQKEDLIDFSSCTNEILSIPFIREKDKKEIFFPINLIQNLYASNGMAFHSDKTIAFNNALSEIIERFVKFEVIKKGLNLVKIKHKFNSNEIQIYDATLDKYPVMAASFIKNNKIALAFGCDLNQEKAINKAYLEIMQGRINFDEIGEFSDKLNEVSDSFNLESHFISNTGLVHTNFLKENNNTPYKWNFERYSIEQDIYFREYKFNQFYAYQIIVPNFSEVYPIEDLIYNNRNQGKFYRDLVLQYKNFDKNIIIEELEQLNPYLDLGKFIGIVFQKEILVIDFINMLKNNKINMKFDNSYIKMQELVNKLQTISN